MPKKKKEVTEEEILQFARELFLTPDNVDSTNHKYTNVEITRQLRDNYEYEVTEGTIRNWAKKEGWQTLWEAGQRHGIEQIEKERKATESRNEKIVNETGKKRVDRYKTNQELYKGVAYAASAIINDILLKIKNKEKLDRMDIMFINAQLPKLNYALAMDDKEATQDNSLDLLRRLIANPGDASKDPELVAIIMELDNDNE